MSRLHRTATQHSQLMRPYIHIETWVSCPWYVKCNDSGNMWQFYIVARGEMFAIDLHDTMKHHKIHLVSVCIQALAATGKALFQ